MNKLPNFMIIGAGKSGTTALYEYLAEHPDVYMSPVKETNFFALEGEMMVDPKDDPEQMFHYPWSVTNWEDYVKLFDGVETEKAIGEVSPMYLYSEEAAFRIKERFPDMKLIVILRNPVDRLYSRFMHLARENRKPTSRFEDALDRETIWWRRNDLVKEGFYHNHLQKYYDLFDKDQIKVILYDDFKSDPLKEVQNIYEFIGVNGWHEPDFNTEYNVSGLIKNPVIDKLIGQKSVIKELAAMVNPRLKDAIISNQQLKKWINQLRKKNLMKVPIPNNIRNAMIESVYGSDIQQLQHLINRDLSNWLKIRQS
ncbi:MAG: sulfotransferase [Flammeovirgaceae bacterium]|nr:sulfotransferase [Flammeovirgaceae bacterium]MBE61946.1 sulfotransferase [Flammeovirgaceae bacterium]MBR06604.1 sulfotransferase [Rickettsiales bacterium]HCX23590.1 sulfotransferase [Cytophagales bacterium]